MALSPSEVKIAVAAHKPYPMPEGLVYFPLQVGAANHARFGIAGDDTGENISARNANWCELTGLYWCWKNLAAEGALGLVHYRRHFRGEHGIATDDEIVASLNGAPCLLPKPRRYFIETNRSQYDHAHHAIDLDRTREIIAERSPRHLDAFDRVMRRTWGHRFNMFAMRRSLFDGYCAWLFDILFELERTLDISGYSPYDARVFGFVSERLLDVWIEAERVDYVERAVVNLESQHWTTKIARFLARKFLTSPSA